MSFELSARDRQRLVGVHVALVAVVETAAKLTPIRFTVLEGLRTLERQRKLVAQGASKTLKSRHLTGHAVDLAPLVDTDGDGDIEVSWHWPHYHLLAKEVKRAAQAEGVEITWGGDWRTFRDGPHWELDPVKYPQPKRS